MSYVYGKRPPQPEGKLVEELKDELYPHDQPYSSVDWNKARYTCGATDLYYEHPYIQDVVW